MLQRVPIQAQDGRLLPEGSDDHIIYATPRAREESISRGRPSGDSEAKGGPLAATRSMRKGASAYSTVAQTWVFDNCMVPGFYGRLDTE